MLNDLNTIQMRKFQKKVLQMEQRNKVINPFKNEILFSEMGMDKHLNNLLYGVWDDQFEDEESLLSF